MVADAPLVLAAVAITLAPTRTARTFSRYHSVEIASKHRNVANRCANAYDERFRERRRALRASPRARRVATPRGAEAEPVRAFPRDAICERHGLRAVRSATRP